MEIIHFQLIVVKTAAIPNQLVTIQPTVTEKMMAIKTYQFPLITLNVWALNPMKKKNVIIRPVEIKHAIGTCGLNGLNVINFAMVLNFADNYASVVMI
jgi:hypothetical protein